jgi:hypothetical protein
MIRKYLGSSTKSVRKMKKKKGINNAKSSQHMKLKKRSWRWLKTWNIWELDGCNEHVSQEKKPYKLNKEGRRMRRMKRRRRMTPQKQA